MAERTNPHANLIIGAQDEATPVFEKIKASSQSMAAGVEQAATKAAGAVGGIGDKAAPAAQKLDGVTASMIRQVQRLNAELEAGGARNAAYFEKMASIKGADLSALAPYLADLKKAEAAQRVATTGLDQMGMSAKQTTAALRQVPMQFTDIVVSLQGGQSAMQVFLQQGGQLKDMFGGAGNAARALGGYVLGLVNPFTIAASAVAGIAVAYNQGSKESEAFNKTLTLTGNAAGTSASSLADMARAIDATSAGITQSKAAEVLNSIAASGDVAADKLQRYAQVAIEFGRAGGAAADEVAKAFSQLAGDPLAAVEKLNKSTNFLTADIYNQIKALDEEGRSTDAARVAQDAYASMLDQRIPKLKDNLGLLESGWMGVKGAAAEAWDSMLNVGRAQTIGGRLEAAQKLLADYESTLPGKRTTEQVARVAEAGGVNGLRNQIAGLQELMETQRKADEQQRANNQSTQAAINLSKQASQFDTDLEKQRKAVAKATELYTTALAAGNLSESARAQLEKDYLKTVSGITAAKEQRATSTRKENKDLADQQRIYAELAGVSSTYYKELAAAQEQRAKGKVSEAQYVAYVNELIQKQPFAVALTKEEAKAQQTLDKANLDAAASREKYIASLATGLDKIQADTAAQIEATERIGLSKEAIAELDAAKLEMLATDLELQAIKAMDRNLDQQTYDALKKQAAAYRELGIAKKGGAAKEAALEMEKANAEAAKKAQEDWERAAEQINSSLTDALLRGFESGKDFAKNLRDTIVNMFQTLVLRPTISAVLSPVSTAINGVVSSGLSALGIGGQAASMAGLFGVGGGATAASFAQNVATGVSVGLSSSEAIAAATAAGQAMGASAGTGFMASLSAVPGWGWALGGVALLGGLLGGGGETRSGASYAIGPDGRAVKTEGPSGGEINGDAVRAAIETTVTTINGVLKSLGSAASVSGFVAGLESSENGKGFVFAGGRVGDAAFGEAAGRSSVEAMGNLTAEQAVAALALDLKQATIQALQAAQDLPDAVKRQLDGVNAETLAAEEADRLISTLTQQAQAVAGFREAVAALPFEGLKSLSYDATLAMLDAAGGLQNFTSAAQSYYANFYSAEEQQAWQLQQLTEAMAALGLAVPATAEAFRGLVDAALAAGDAARAAQLMALSADVKKALDAQSSAQGVADSAREPDFFSFSSTQVGLGSGGGGGGGGGDSWTSSAANDWKSATDSIKSTMDDLRKTLIGSSRESLAYLQAEYAIAVAKAKSGDLEAYKSLPEMARAIAQAATTTAGSALEEALITARAAQALDDVLATRQGGAAPASITPSILPGVVQQPQVYLPPAQQPQVYLPPAQLPQVYLPPAQLPSAGNAEVAQALRDLADRLDRIERNTGAANSAANRTADALEKSARGIQPLTTLVVT